MGSRAVLDPQQRNRGEDKQKNEPVERNRRVLRDIGNLGPLPAVGGKPRTRIGRPSTRRLNTKILANGPADQEKNKKPLVEEEAKVTAVFVPHKEEAPTEPTPETIITRQNPKKLDEVKEEKSASGRLSRKKAVTLTSILTARSKAASGINTRPCKDYILNIDAKDVTNELAAVEYVDDIYKFYKNTEDESRVYDYMSRQIHINSKMRSILVDWLIEVHNKFQLMPETLYLTINIVDRYLSAKIVSRRELQLVGISSMLVASKYEEIWAPEVNDFVCISAKSYGREEVLAMEKSILGKLQWHLTVPTSYVFLLRYIKAAVSHDSEMENMVFFLSELGLVHYSTTVLYGPSMIAASAVYAAHCTLGKSPSWTETLEHHTGFSEDQLRDCAKLLVGFHSEAGEGKLKAVHRKFSDPDRDVVALLPPAKTSLLAPST